MQKTKIDWADYTWNPVTWCRHGCHYCYARRIARRFGGVDFGGVYEYDEKSSANPYPAGFAPSLHEYRLDEPQRIKKPQNIFVCSMADLFGEWVPDEWIQAVFEACKKAPQHRYLFLTKNTDRYFKTIRPNDNFWYGSTITDDETPYFHSKNGNTFLSIEPIQSDFRGDGDLIGIKWVIVGAETGNRKGKIVPKRDWIENIVKVCRAGNVPVFMKNSLKEIWGEPLIQEYPWEDCGV